jgi:hypothetical protein
VQLATYVTNAFSIGVSQLRKELLQPTLEGEARLLLLIDAFTTSTKSLEGRTKLAKLDFLLRYPNFLARALAIKKPELEPMTVDPSDEHSIESRMVRYRYGPWDPSYYATLGRLIGKGLVIPVPAPRGISYRTTDLGQGLAQQLASDESWVDVAARTKLLKRHFDLRGTTLKDFIYEHFPEVTGASWGDAL